MDEIYVTYVDDEHVDNHDYDDNTDDDHDNNKDINGHIPMIYRWSIDNIRLYKYTYSYRLLGTCEEAGSA